MLGFQVDTAVTVEEAGVVWLCVVSSKGRFHARLHPYMLRMNCIKKNKENKSAHTTRKAIQKTPSARLCQMTTTLLHRGE